MIFKGLVFAIDNFLSNKELRLDAFLTCLPIFKDVSSHSFTILARYLPNVISYCPSQKKINSGEMVHMCNACTHQRQDKMWKEFRLKDVFFIFCAMSFS